MTSVGKTIPHDSAAGHVTGTAPYLDDLPRRSDELFVGFVGSPDCGREDHGSRTRRGPRDSRRRRALHGGRRPGREYIRRAGQRRAVAGRRRAALCRTAGGRHCGGIARRDSRGKESDQEFKRRRPSRSCRSSARSNWGGSSDRRGGLRAATSTRRSRRRRTD